MPNQPNEAMLMLAQQDIRAIIGQTEALTGVGGAWREGPQQISDDYNLHIYQDV